MFVPKCIVSFSLTDRTFFIDFEYGGFSYQAFEKAPYFCEYEGTVIIDVNCLLKSCVI
jgi:hypothetical protein